MPVNGLDSVNKKLMEFAAEGVQLKAESAIRAVIDTGAGYAQLITPIDTSLLVNSQYTTTGADSYGVYGAVGYTAEYAAAVHAKKGTLKGLPRANGNGSYWSPDGEPQFLTKAFNENKAELNQIFYGMMKV